MQRTGNLTNKIDTFLVTWIFPLGLIIQLTGVLWIGRGSGWAAQTYCWLMLPAFISILLNLPGIKSWRPGWGELAFLAFLAWACISVSWSDANISFIQPVKRCLYILLYIYALIRLSNSPARLEKVLLFCVLLAVIAALASLVYHYGILHQGTGYREYRIQSLIPGGLADLGFPIMAGIYYGIFALILFMWQAQKKNIFWKETSLSWLGLIILGVYILMTWSRGPWLAVTCTVIFTLITIRDRPSFYFCIVAAIICLSMILFHIHFFNHQIADDTYGGRTGVWKVAWEKITEHPWAGYGYYASFAGKNSDGVILFHPHNYFLQMLRMYGAIGGFFFLVMLVQMFYLIIKCWSRTLVKIAAVILILSLISMLTDIQHIVTRPEDTWLYIWLPFGLLLGASYRQRRVSSS